MRGYEIIIFFGTHKYIRNVAKQIDWLAYEVGCSEIESLGVRYCVNFYDKPAVLSY